MYYLICCNIAVPLPSLCKYAFDCDIALGYLSFYLIVLSLYRFRYYCTFVHIRVAFIFFFLPAE